MTQREDESRFEQWRHKPPTVLARPRELVIVCAPLRSQVNLARIVRAAGCCGVTRIVACGSVRIDKEISRDAEAHLHLETHRSLPPLLPKLRAEGFALVGLEQAANSVNLPDFSFPRRTALVIGNERQGLTPDVLSLLEAVVEIPVWGQPLSHNVATAAAMAMYEYCRQFPHG